MCLDATAWTAIATIVVGILGLYGAFWKPLASWIWKPILRLEVERLADHSDLSHDRRMFVLHIPVSNRARRRAATDIEVFLESIQRQHADRRFELPTYLPVRLLWCHGQSAICDRIAGGAYRLLDLGYITSQRGTYDPATDKTEQTDLNELGFRTEISSRFPVHLPIGS